MKKKAFFAALPYTLPILVGFLFLGASYGLLMRSLGFSFFFSLATNVFIFAGSMEFLTANLLLGAFNPLSAFLLTLMVNARHLFYGISMLGRFKGLGPKKAYLIFAQCDETFSVNSTAKVPDGVDVGFFMFFVSLLDQLYWIAGTSLGSLIGYLIHFNTKGIEFVMTAMFIVIFLDQWEQKKDHRSAIIGLVCSIVSLLIFGKGAFIIPAMALMVLSFIVFRKNIEGEAS